MIMIEQDRYHEGSFAGKESITQNPDGSFTKTSSHGFGLYPSDIDHSGGVSMASVLCSLSVGSGERDFSLHQVLQKVFESNEVHVVVNGHQLNAQEFMRLLAIEKAKMDCAGQHFSMDDPLGHDLWFERDPLSRVCR